MPLATVIPGSSFAQQAISRASRVLLINPPVYDYRLEWASWHYPLGLEMVAAMLVQSGSEVKLIDCLALGQSKLTKHKLGVQQVEGYDFVRWCFGIPLSTLRVKLQELTEWNPDAVMLTTLNSLWSQAATDTIQMIREVLPKATIVLGGMYPTYAPDHAVAHSGADLVVTGNVPETFTIPSQYRPTVSGRKSAGILFYAGGYSLEQPELRTRPTTEIIDDIRRSARGGIRQFVFFDERIRPEDGEAFLDLLDALAAAKLGISVVLPGNAPPRLISSKIAKMLRPAGVKQLYLRCELDFCKDPISYVDNIAEYDRCTKLLVEQGGFYPRSGDFAAMLVVGLPFEDLAEVSERLIRLAHVVGSVLLVPFQYVPSLHTQPIFQRSLSLNGHLTDDELNSKIFPLSRLSGQTLDEYMELVRLAALTNSKYRSKTFDFLGDGLAARLLRESVRSQRWNPFSTDSVVSPEEELFIPLTTARKNEA